MTTISWDAVEQRIYETGVDHGVLYPPSGIGVPWNGLTAINEKPSGASPTPIFADNIKYLMLISPEDFSLTLEAYTYPDEFAICEGTVELDDGVFISQQMRLPFGLSYRTLIGSATQGTKHGYKLHLVYGALASPTERGYSTLNDSSDIAGFSWDLSTTPVEVPGNEPTAHLTIDSRRINRMALAAIESILYGTPTTEARLPTPTEIVSILASDWEELLVVDNGDGTWTASGPDNIISLLTDSMFQINSSSVEMIDNDTFRLSSV